jgi:hypothetical protein
MKKYEECLPATDINEVTFGQIVDLENKLSELCHPASVINQLIKEGLLEAQPVKQPRKTEVSCYVIIITSYNNQSCV